MTLTEQDAARLQEIRLRLARIESEGLVTHGFDNDAFLLRLIEARPQVIGVDLASGPDRTAQQEFVTRAFHDAALDGARAEGQEFFKAYEAAAAELVAAHGLQARAEAAEAALVEARQKLQRLVDRLHSGAETPDFDIRNPADRHAYDDACAWLWPAERSRP